MKNRTECSLAQHCFPIRSVIFMVSSVCLLVRVTMVDKNTAVVCCLVAISAIKKKKKKKRKCKMWSKKWYLKRNISCDVHLVNELLETYVPWDDTIMVLAGKLRNLWNSLSELHSSPCERRLERRVLRHALLPVSAFYSVFPSGMTSHSKIAQLNWECIRCLRHAVQLLFNFPQYAVYSIILYFYVQIYYSNFS
jgi:hypothetical protein